MEVVRQWDEVVEAETEEVALRGRLPRHQNTTMTTITTTTITTSKDSRSSSSSSSSDHESSGSSSSEDGTLKKEIVNGKSSNGKTHEGNGGTKSTNGHFGLEDGVVDDLPISKESAVDQILEFEANDLKVPLISAASNHHYEIEFESKDLPTSSPLPSQKSPEEELGVQPSLNSGKTEYNEAELRDKSIEELRELYLAKLCEKPGPHEFYCPNCKTCITKVYVRDREVEIRPSTPPRPEPVERIRCTSCLSFLLIPVGWFFPKWAPADREHNPDEGVPAPSYGLHDPQDDHSQAAPTKSPASKQSGVANVPPLDNKSRDNKSRDGTGLNFVLPFNKTEIAGQSSRTPVPEEALPATETPATKPSSNDSDNNTGLENQAPSNDLHGTLHDQRPSLLDSFVSAITKPWENNFKNGVNLPTPVPNEKKLSTVPESSSGVTINVITGSKTSEIDVVTVSTQGPTHLSEVIASGGKLDGAVEDNFKEPAQDILPDSTAITIAVQTPLLPQQRSRKTWEIVKSFVYGGLTESITSLGIVTSAASGDATTLNIVALAIANLLGELFVIGHNLWELKDDKSKVHSNDTEEHVDRYEEVLGKRENFALHAFVAILSFLVFGLVSPVVYGFSFRQSDDKDLKLVAVAAASLICITILSFAKASTQKPPKKYIKTVTYYIVVGLGVSGASYLAGELIIKLLEKLNWSESTQPAALPLLGMGTGNRSWQSY